MSFNFLEQSVQYAFDNTAKYGKNGKKRILGNVNKDVSAEDLIKVGKAISHLQDDKLGGCVLITRQAVAEDQAAQS